MTRPSFLLADRVSRQKLASPTEIGTLLVSQRYFDLITHERAREKRGQDRDEQGDGLNGH